MAAPDTAYYTTPRLKIREGGTLVEDIKFAKFISPYTTTTEAKALFYLDKVFKDSTFDPDGFIGIVTTAANIAMHAAARKFPLKNGAGYYLRDAGLNTLAKVTVGSYPNTSMTQSDAIENTFKVVFTVVTAFYTSNHVLKVKLKSIGCANPSNPANYTDASFLTLSLSPLAAATTYTYNPAIIQIGDIEDPDAYLFTAPNRYEIWVQIQNDEGTFEIQADTLTAVSFPVNMKYSSTSFLDAAMNGGQSTYYKNTAELNSYTYLFTNSASSSVASGGYYVAPRTGSEQYTMTFEVSSTGQITGIGLFDWYTIRIPRDYFGFRASNASSSFNLQLAYDEAVNNGWNAIGTIYESYDGVYYYVADTGSTYAANGYYMIAYGYDLASSGWMRLYNGQIVESS